MVSKAKGIFSYIFDLETELHISDDAPIDISTGLFRASGTVLMCEDFQIIVQLKSNIGERIGNALIRVEPWKLLEALQEKLRAGISLGKNKMASRIMKDGPKLATKNQANKFRKDMMQLSKRLCRNRYVLFGDHQEQEKRIRWQNWLLIL